ncbi:MAG: aldo/keto reductase, partial [Clostridium sp.]
LHNLGEHRTQAFDDFGIWEFLAEKKAQGLIRNLGFSFHDKADLLDEILTAHPEMDFVQLQINYADWDNPTIESRLCYETARKHGKEIIIMEPVKGGNLAVLPEKLEDIFKAVNPDASVSSWAIRYAASLEGIITVLSGMSDISQMKDNLSYMKEFKPLSEEEREAVQKVQKALSEIPTVPCTACAYCMKGCPENIAIYGTFQAVNMLNIYGNMESASGSYTWNTEGHGWNKASACIECGKCEEVCPQHIHIREELKKAAGIFEA